MTYETTHNTPDNANTDSDADFDGSLFSDDTSPPLSPSDEEAGLGELEEWVWSNFDVFTN